MRTPLKALLSALFALALIAPLQPAHALVFSSSVSPAASLTVTASSKTLLVRWVAPTKSRLKITGYQVTAVSGSWRKVVAASATARSIKLASLVNGKKYSISLQAVAGKYVSKSIAKTATPSARLYSNSIFFSQPSDMFLGSEDQELHAMSSGPAVTFQSRTPTICTIVNGFVHAVALGDCIIRASSPATSSYAAATPVDLLLTIGVPPTPMNKTLLWSDEFDGAAGTGPNSATWTADTTDGCPSPYSNCGWGNSEREYYLANANKVDGSVTGLLNILATRQTNSTNYNCYYGRCEWLSGKITTYRKVSFTYGYMESRIKLPAGNGTWPAFWMLGSNIATTPWPRSGEIDITEYKGSMPSVTYGTLHFADSGGGHQMLGATKDTLVDLSLDFHRYGVLWKPTEVVFYIDDNVVYTARKSDSGLAVWPFGPNAQGVDPSFYLIFNLAMGGQFGGDIDSGLSQAQMSVDWVRYYSVDGLGKVTNG